MSYALMLLYCGFLICLQLYTGWALAHGDLGGRVPFETMWLFFGINLPTMLLGAAVSREESVQQLKEPVGCLLMALIMANFMRAGAISHDWNQWNGILHILSAQSLWIAVPTCRALSRQ